MAAVVDLLVLQTELADLLRERLAVTMPKVRVLTPADIASEEEEKGKAPVQAVPAVNVVYMGHKFSAATDRQRSDGKAALLAQLLVLEVVTRNVRNLKTGADARNEGGVIAMAVLRAVMGERLPSAIGPLKLVPGPPPVYRGGNQYLHLMLSADLQISK